MKLAVAKVGIKSKRSESGVHEMGVDETGVTGLSHHLGPLDVTDAEDDLGDGVGADHLHQDHVGAVAHLRLHRRQLHHLEGGRQQSCRLGEKVCYNYCN